MLTLVVGILSGYAIRSAVSTSRRRRAKDALTNNDRRRLHGDLVRASHSQAYHAHERLVENTEVNQPTFSRVRQRKTGANAPVAKARARKATASGEAVAKRATKDGKKRTRRVPAEREPPAESQVSSAE